MSRTTDDLVKGVLQDDYGPKADGTLPSLTRYIAIANLVVNKVATCAATKGDTQSDEVLTEMETWLAAHYYTRSDKALASKSTLSSSASYQGKTDMGLNASYYGQSALNLDFTGCLSAVTTPNKSVGMEWLGKPPSERIAYENRD